MSRYRVLVDGVDIYYPDYPSTQLHSPVVVQDLESSGSFDFILPAGHTFREFIQPNSVIDVLEDGKSIFFGGAADPQVDFNNRLTYHCSGALSWLNRVPLPPDCQPNPGTVKDTSTYVTEIIDYYNCCVDQAHQLTLAVLPEAGTNPQIREWSITKTAMDALRDEISAIDGVMLARHSETTGETGIRLTRLAPYIGQMEALNQPIRLNLNLTDVRQSGQEIYTAAIASGKDCEMSEAVIIDSLARKRGYICKSLKFDLETVADLQAACRDWLLEQSVAGVQVDVTAYDLHTPYPDDYERLELARKVRFDGTPWGLGDVYAPITKVTVDISTGKKTVGLGFTSRRMASLTKQLGRLLRNVRYQ